MAKSKIAKATSVQQKRIKEVKRPELDKNGNILFSFDSLTENEYFNLDGSCENWSQDLFYALKQISGIKAIEAISGNYTKGTLRIHNHAKCSPPCELPEGVEKEDFYQLRISQSKGGVHGIFVENVFYVMWFDPLHNLYPSDKHGGLRVIKPASTCCKDREIELEQLAEENERLRSENAIYKEILEQV